MRVKGNGQATGEDKRKKEKAITSHGVDHEPHAVPIIDSDDFVCAAFGNAVDEGADEYDCQEKMRSGHERVLQNEQAQRQLRSCVLVVETDGVPAAGVARIKIASVPLPDLPQTGDHKEGYYAVEGVHGWPQREVRGFDDQILVKRWYLVHRQKRDLVQVKSEEAELVEPVAAELAVLEFNMISKSQDIGLVSIVEILCKHDVEGESGVNKLEAVDHTELVGIRWLADEPIANFSIADIIVGWACLVICAWVVFAAQPGYYWIGAVLFPR